ncbi:MAG: sulfite exporter TauE/SafE family protein, partial [Porticoccaceae bacterium]|nr:sulfite exporter TauE/SafE family protein [Porticoccaceae bacterium]
GYNLGRVVSYSAAGALVGFLGMLSRQLHSDMMVLLRTVAALLLVMMALYLADWWRGLVRLEKLGTRFWQLLQPLGKRLMPVRTPGRALLLGMVWGWLPCGLVYSALALAATAANPVASALGMAIFGLCTIPAMLAGGIFSDQVRAWLQNRTWRTLMALLLLGFAAWVFWTGAGHVLSGHHGEGDLHCEY